MRMLGRLMWFVAGAATALWGRRRVISAAERFLPSTVRREAAARARSLRRDLHGAVDDGRTAMRQRAETLRGVAPPSVG